MSNIQQIVYRYNDEGGAHEYQVTYNRVSHVYEVHHDFQYIGDVEDDGQTVSDLISEAIDLHHDILNSNAAEVE